MNQSRKFRRRSGFTPAPFTPAPRGMQLPPEWNQVSADESARAGAAMQALQKMLPQRGLVLLSIPGGTSTQNVEAMACVHNLTDRSLVANTFQAFLDYWSGEVVMAHPDRAMVAALREGVASINDIPLGEVLKQLTSFLGQMVRSITHREFEAAADAALLLAASAISIYERAHPAQQHQAEGGSADASGAPPPAPMPPPREWPKGNTKETLVADLLERPQSENRDQLIEMARAGKFHDYEAEVATPKALLIDVLARFGFPDLAGKARDGGYDDEHATVVQQEELRHEVGSDIYDSLVGSKPRGTA